MAPSNICPAESRWRDFLEGNLPSALAKILGRHLDGCAACQQTLERLTAGNEPWLAAAREGGGQAGTEAPLRRVMSQLEAEGEPAAPPEPAAGPALDFL